MRWLPVAWLLAAVAAHAGAAPLRVDQVAPGVYVHIGKHQDVEQEYDGDIANIGFVVGSEAVAVIDTGGSYAIGMALKASVRAVTRLPIRYVINTHGHPDHVFGNSAFIDANDATQPQFIGHAMLAPAMGARSDTYVRNLKKQLGDAAAQNSRLVPPDVAVQDRLSLDLGRRTLQLQAWPKAHTNNDLTVLDSASGTLWTGDLLFIERTPSIDGDVKGWLAAIERLQQLPALTTIPGHGPVTRYQHQALARQRDYLEALLRDVRAAIGQGAGMSETMETAAAAERGRWQLFDAVNRRNVNLLYPNLEWE